MLQKNIHMLIFATILVVSWYTYSNTNNDTTIHTYFWANYSSFSGNHKTAHTHYKQLLNSAAPCYTYKGYLYFLFETKQYTKIVELIPTLDKQFAYDVNIQLLFIQSLENTKKQKEADEKTIQLSTTCTTHAEVTFRASQAYLRKQQPDKALTTITTYLNKTPRQVNNFVFYFLKSQIYIMQNKPTEALENVQKCLELHPRFDKGWLALATLQEQTGYLEDAIKGYATFLELSGRNPEIEQHLFALTIQKNMHNTQNRTVIAHQSPHESALLFYQQKQYKKATMHIDQCLKQNPTNTQARLLKIQILSATGEYTKAITLMCDWFDKEPHKQLWIHTLFLLHHTDVPHQKIASSLQTLASKHPQSPWPQLYLADLAMRNKNYTQAITYLEKSLPHITTDELSRKTLHQLGLLYFEQQNYEKMSEFLEQAYAHNTTCAPLANDLAYCLSQQKNCNIQRAQKLISQALEQDKTNPFYIDTQAVIYYQQKKYAEAEQLLQPLHISTNPTILLNLAQIKYALQNKTDAQNLTEKAAKYVTLNHEKEALKKMQNLLKQ